MKNVIFVLLLFMITSTSSAATSESTTIKMLRGFNATQAEGFYFEIEGVIPNPLGCPNSGMIRAGSTEIADFDQQFSMLLAAFMAGKTVKVQIDESECSSNYPKFINVLMYK